jgi:hypothetical protein
MNRLVGGKDDRDSELAGRLNQARTNSETGEGLQRRPWADPPEAGSWSTQRLAISAVVRRDRDPPRPLQAAQPALAARQGTARAAWHPSRRWAA